MRGFVDAGKQEAGRIRFVAPEIVQHDLAAGAVPEAEAAEQVEAPVPVLEAGRSATGAGVAVDVGLAEYAKAPGDIEGVRRIG